MQALIVNLIFLVAGTGYFEVTEKTSPKVLGVSCTSMQIIFLLKNS